MNYQNILKLQLLSPNNINFLVNTILTNFKISQKAINKCTNIVTNNLNKYLDNISRYPENDDELIEAINFLNKKCFEEFIDYLSTKYPNKNLLRNDYSNLINSPPESKIPVENIIILSEEEKNNLLKTYEKKEVKKNPSEDFLSYLTNPQILQMFSMMINNMNSKKDIPKENKQYVIDDILDEDQVKALLNKTNKPEISIPIESPKPDVLKTAPKIEVPKIEAPKSESTDLINLSELTIEKLPLVEKKLKSLVQQKNEFLQQDNKEMVEKIDKEKELIISSVQNFKKDLEKKAKESEDKINSISISKRFDATAKNVEILDLKFDPTNDYNDLKNIVIGFKTDQKITDITLVDYYLPFNANNVTRFNNKFTVYFNNRVNRIMIPPGKYEIVTLLDYIKNQANYLDFTVNENKIITIKNNLNLKFDLMIANDTIFHLLGFTEKLDNYKEKLFYSASKQYDVHSNEKVYFNISGTAMDPIEMEFDKDIPLNKSLKRAKNGVLMKQMVLNFNNILGQYYDFILPFKMCFKISYLEKD